MDTVMALMDQAGSLLMTAEGKAIMIGTALEFVLRLVKTRKPLSILHAAVRILRMVGQKGKIVLTLLSKSMDLLERLANLLDKVLPQNVAPAPVPSKKK